MDTRTIKRVVGWLSTIVLALFFGRDISVSVLDAANAVRDSQTAAY